MPHRRARRLPDLTMTVSTPTPAAPAGVASISPVQDIVAELAAGRMVILVDEEDRPRPSTSWRASAAAWSA